MSNRRLLANMTLDDLSDNVFRVIKELPPFPCDEIAKKLTDNGLTMEDVLHFIVRNNVKIAKSPTTRFSNYHLGDLTEKYIEEYEDEPYEPLWKKNLKNLKESE